MEVASPPKRMTRARAAAASTAPATNKSTRGTAVSAKSATTTTTTTRTTSMKRKTRTYEEDDEDDLSREPDAQTTMNKPAKTRGRVRKAVHPEPEQEPQPDAPVDAQVDDAPNTTVVKATRGRPRKTQTTASAVAKQEPAKTRTRARKTAAEDSDAGAATRPVKKTARGRAAPSTKGGNGTITTTCTTEPTPGLKSAVSRPASRAADVIKKTVTFQEPEKENMLPATATKSKIKTTEANTTGMRAKPVRKPTTTGRTTRASARATTPEDKKEKTPLSPKKDGQNRPLSRDASSDDELATYEKTPLKPLMKSPVKPPTGVRKLELPLPEKEKDENSQQALESAGASVFGSPARRPPASPFKDTMKSPAKRVDTVPSLIFSSTKAETQGAQSPSKSSMLQSPAKRPQMSIPVFQPHSLEQTGQPRSPTKISLLNTPAKRPASPLKLLGSVRPTENKPEGALKESLHSSVDESDNGQGLQNQMIKEVAAPQAECLAVVQKTPEAEEKADNENNAGLESPTQLAFPGRLSAVLPRYADPTLKESPLPAPELAIEPSQPTIPEPQCPENVLESRLREVEPEVEGPPDDLMDVDEVETEEQAAPSLAQTTPPQSPPKRHPVFGLRGKDLKDHDISESDDELALSNRTNSKYQDGTTLAFGVEPTTPTPVSSKGSQGSLPSSAAKAVSRAIRSVSRGSKLGFTPLAVQLGEWRASSPPKLSKPQQTLVPPTASEEEFSLLDDKVFPIVESSPSKGFFDDEMKVRTDMENQAAMEAALEADIAARYDDPEFNDIAITNEDVELAAEANEMSLLDSSNADESRAHDDSISEASQEYGDENAVPIDPALLGSRAGAGAGSLAPVTPPRPLAPRTFHTVSKVPLKPADDSLSRSVKRRCTSVSKVSLQRPDGPYRNATVISYSPTKGSSQVEVDGQAEQGSEISPITPKSVAWSSMGTPARTPRRDLNTGLLRGAVVFVDVHTTEGADAGRIFVDLLTQMGARCVKSWPWNPNSPTDGEPTASKIGITHVVFKDGGKRTLEKVKESNGIVQCVGVGWVLDCERENRWVAEKSYHIDPSLVPRGGHNRRKSMEPKAIANMNGTLVTPMKSNTSLPREPQTVPNNYMSRRDSTLWVRTPSEHDEDEDAPGEQDWMSDAGMLTPVPKTPAPEMVAKFAMDITPGTPTTGSFDSLSPEREQLLMRTCPPKSVSFANLGKGLLSQNGDQSVMMRLMAARRKSLQFAPKIASPLSKAWN
ncbi:hypothetical protein F5Y19DRAFT_324668 [Xylariaceae sp. FL1651]|nr:hypothetical protein F5Y19DRAFT_324668 [Xylariaceae sp. FL1651]